jgi:hypothetical protein
VVPRTSSLGILVASGFWGGTICFHMFRGELYLMQSAMLLLTWLGAYLRIPAMFSSFSATQPSSPQVAQQSEPALR